METVTITRAGAPTEDDDEQGNPVLGASSTFDLDTLAIAPLTPEESAALFGPENRGGYTLYLPHGSELRSTDLVEVRGESGFQVWGDAGLVSWRSPFTDWTPGDVAVVRRSS